MAFSIVPASQIASLVIGGDDYVPTAVAIQKEQRTRELLPDAQTPVPQVKEGNKPGMLKLTLMTNKTDAAWDAMLNMINGRIEMTYVSGRKTTLFSATQASGADGVEQNPTDGTSSEIIFTFATSVDTGPPQ